MTSGEEEGQPPAFERTVGSEISQVFPRGLLALAEEGEADWSTLPLFPTDLFAVAAHLLEASGAYQYIVAPYDGATAAMTYKGPTLAPSQRDIDRWVDLGKRWATDWRVMEKVQPYWDALWASRSEKLVVTPKTTKQPRWWRAAHALLVIADEACEGMGYKVPASTDVFDLSDTSPFRWANHLNSRRLTESTRRNVLPAASSTKTSGEHISRHVALDSVAPQASRDVVRVLPKGRTASLGCTPRTLSHNLALLPPHGRSNAYWHQPRLEAEAAARLGEQLNLLLIPFPYSIPDGCFLGEAHNGANGDGPWGRFSVQQKWLEPHGATADAKTKASERRSFIDFVSALVDRAEKTSGKTVHGVVFPELALDWATYDAVARTLVQTKPAIELLMSGVSMDCNGTPGNLVTTSLFHSVGKRRFVETHSRMKHHRWCIDDEQIRSYGLEAELPPGRMWWEYLEVGERVIHIDVVRQSTLTAVICEDLARVDPGLAELRLLGPNLVVALLMDGPQLKTRWPARYATALSEDPGSSVLTFTSAGLIARSNAKHHSRRNTIALWKNYPSRNVPLGGPSMHEIDLPDHAHAMLLSLSSEAATEATMDGRPNSDAVAWVHQDHQPVGLLASEIDAHGWTWIVR